MDYICDLLGCPKSRRGAQRVPIDLVQGSLCDKKVGREGAEARQEASRSEVM